MFVCFAPLYFVYGSVIPREFSLFERLMSLLYTVFFIVFLPFFAAFRYKVWVNWGLAAYGVLIYIPIYFYPAAELITGDDPKLTKVLLAACLRGIYGMMQAPFAALSPLIGDKAASALVYWILPLALFWPLVLKVLRFYRRAYLSEQLNPMPKVNPVAATAHSGPAVKPEVLGTVITAPVVAASPDEVTGMAALSQNSSARAKDNKENTAEKEKESEPIRLSAPEPEPASIPLDPPVTDKAAEVSAPEVSGSLGEGSSEAVRKERSKIRTPNIIELGAPVSSTSGDGEQTKEGSGPTASGSSGESGPVIELGAPATAPGKDGSSGQSDVKVENDNDTL